MPSADSRRAPSTPTAPAKRRADHGFWPYLLPYLAFMGLVELSRRVPDWAPLLLPLKALVPLGLILYFRLARGAYPELSGYRWSGAPLDLLVGAVLAITWAGPPLLWLAVRPEDTSGFDTAIYGEGRELFALSLRMLGYAVATPLLEELFVRSWAMRYADVFQSRGDFRKVPVARFTPVSFAVMMAVFIGTHGGWELYVMWFWALASTLYFYWRGHLMAVVLLHAATNAALLLFAALSGGVWDDGSGSPVSLWFLV